VASRFFLPNGTGVWGIERHQQNATSHYPAGMPYPYSTGFLEFWSSMFFNALWSLISKLITAHIPSAHATNADW